MAHVGFELQYQAICGGKFYNLGELKSPNYPEQYLSRKDCVWEIEVEEGKQVALKFDTFVIEGDDGCGYDYLELRDGDSEDSPLLGKLCGRGWEGV